MAVRIATGDPAALLRAIRKLISERAIETWQLTGDGDVTHTPPQWRNKAWFRPRVDDGALVMQIVRPKDSKISTEVYAVYHGRFIEMLLAHVDKSFENARASAMPEHGDLV